MNPRSEMNVEKTMNNISNTLKEILKVIVQINENQIKAHGKDNKENV